MRERTVIVTGAGRGIGRASALRLARGGANVVAAARTARELAEDLSRYLNGEPILARPVGRIERAWRWCKRKPAVAGACALAVTLLLVLGLGGLSVAAQQATFARHQTRLRNDAEQRRQEAANAWKQEAMQRQQAEENERIAITERRTARRNLYVAHMNLVQQAFELNDPGRGAELLRRHLPADGHEDLRGFEWYYWWRRCHRYSWSVDHTAVRRPSHSMAVSPDGRLLAFRSIVISLPLP